MSLRYCYPFLLKLAASALLFSGSIMAAPSGRISGTVVDRNTGDPLPGANIRVEGTSLGAATDIEGAFAIPNVPGGTQTLVVTFVGYESVQIPVEVPDGATVTLEIEMEWEGVRGDEVVVTAAAEGQMGAINRQLASNTITSIVSRDRIREVPDVNAAESIGRLPGVSLQRSGGEANKVVIRGLSPKYNTVTVNGTRLPATGGDDRSVDLSLISNQMLDGIEVMKANMPYQDADAIGGSIDLKLRTAPDRLSLDLLAQGGFNSLQDSYENYKLSGVVSGRFLEGKLGLIGSLLADGFDRSADKFQADHRQATSAQTQERVIIIERIPLREETVFRTRRGGSLVSDYRLPRGKLTFHGFYNRLKNDQLFRINELAVNVNRHYYDIEDRVGTTSIFTGALGWEQDFNTFKVDASVARSQTKTDNPEDFRWRFSQEGAAFTGAPDENTPADSLPSLQNVDTLGTGLQDMYTYSTYREENEWSAQLNLHVPFQLSSYVGGQIRVGGKLRWLDRLNDEEHFGRNGLYYGSGAGNLSETFECISDARPEWGLDSLIGTVGRLPINFVMTDEERDDFLDGDYPLGFVADVDLLTELTREMQACGPEINRRYSIGSLGRDYDGTEQYQAAYAMAEINLGRGVTLTPGIRWEGDQAEYNGQRYREVQSNNVQAPPADLVFLTTNRDHSFWLPMVHFRWDPTDWLQLRLAYTESLTRPDYIQYAPITTINQYGNYVRAANSLLTPAESRNFDGSLSIYQNHIGLFTVSPFHKRIDDLILWVDYNLHPDVGALPGMNVPDEWVDLRPRANTYINNPFETRYTGIELDWQTNFWYLPSLLKGLVFNANYTYITSETEYQAYFLVDSDSLVRVRPPVYLKEVRTDSTRIGRMPDQPKHVANLTMGYDYKRFAIRLSMRFQTNTSTFVNSTNPILDTFSGDYTRWDLSVRQGLLEGFEIFLNLTNLTSRPDENFRGIVGEIPSYTEYYGLTTDIGLRYRF